MFLIGGKNLSYRVDELYSYILAHDGGFSPNPFWGVCTLACCKPKIRETVGNKLRANPRKQIWIVGLSPKHYDKGNDIVYIMRVDQAMTFAEYWFTHSEKRPNFEKGSIIYKCGDNIYKPKDVKGFHFHQLQSMHSNPSDGCNLYTENQEAMNHDLGGKYVLLSYSFVYFGSTVIHLPNELRDLVVARGHKCRFSPDTLSAFSSFIEGHRTQIESGAVLGKPHLWSATDESWKQP
jgi:hypothetical protein